MAQKYIAKWPVDELRAGGVLLPPQLHLGWPQAVHGVLGF
jgi:hypothetical protein